MDVTGLTAAIRKNVERVMVGKRDAIDLLLIALICQGHALIEDAPGVGKTTLVSALARSLGLSFGRIQFTPDVLPSDIIGFSAPNLRTGEFEMRQGSVMKQIVLADEINRTPPKTQSALLEVMEERQVTVDGVTTPVPAPFLVLATQNPIEYIGTYPLPEAQLDRFLLRISIGYPSLAEEMAILSRFEREAPLQELTPVASAQDVLDLQTAVQGVLCAEPVKEYIARIAHATRDNQDLLLGVSPRGALSLMRAAKARALLCGRDHTLPDDVQHLAMPALCHRLILRPEARLREMTPERIIKNILSTTLVPSAQ